MIYPQPYILRLHSRQLYRFFPLPLEFELRLALPPALSAFSVRLALCFFFSKPLSAFVWYFTFLLIFNFVFTDKFALVRAFVRSVVVNDGIAVADFPLVDDREYSIGPSSPGEERIRGGPCMIVSGSKSSTTVTVASCSSSSYSSSSGSMGCPCNFFCCRREEEGRFGCEDPSSEASSSVNSWLIDRVKIGHGSRTHRRHHRMLSRLQQHSWQLFQLAYVFAIN
jgi:hypothetical protein